MNNHPYQGSILRWRQQCALPYVACEPQAHRLSDTARVLLSGGMPLFNALFTYICFHALQRCSNMYAFLGVRERQSYEGVLARKMPSEDGTVSDQYAIKHTIALFHLYVASSLDPGIGTLRKKLELYRKHVVNLKKMNGEGTDRDWRKELAECLSKWHPIFQKAVKRRKSRRECEDLTDVFDTQVDENFL